MIVKRIGILSCGKVMGVIYAVLGLIFSVPFGLVMVMGAIIGHNVEEAAPPIAIWAVGFAMIFLMPILYGVMGFISGIVTAWLYNTLGVKVAGGLEVDLE